METKTAQRLGIPVESLPGETRVAATPTTARALLALGYDVLVESGAGARADFSDEAYRQAGARIGDLADVWTCDVVLKINAPSPAEINALGEGTMLVALLRPALDGALLDALTERGDPVPGDPGPGVTGRGGTGRGVTALAMDAVPRISRAQSLDVLSSMANIAGYRAVIEAAHAFGRLFSGQVTAAGSIPPAKVLVAGAGVAGLAAIAAANSLGAIVRATDPRPEVAEQVGSLGAEFLPVEVAQQASTDGYARATTEAYDRRAAEIYAEQAAEVDIVITTALIPGRPAPELLTAAHVASMRPGSVVVDMAAAQGGNVAGTVAGEVVHTENGVTIIGYTDLPGRLPAQASQLYGTNVLNLMKLLTPGKDGRVVLDFEDVVVRTMTVVRDGEKTWPPPPVPVSAAPPPPPAAPVAVGGPKPPADRGRRRYVLAGLGAAALFALAAFSPTQLTGHLTVFVLAVVIGFYVIGNVHHALHTPLMSVTNAISGIVVVGALLQIGDGRPAVTALSTVAILLASINVFGGFAVTRRMLSMFSRS